MGGAPYMALGPILGDGLIFVSHLYVKERSGKLPTVIFIIRIVAAATIDFSLIQAPFCQSRARTAGYRADTSPYVVNSSRIKWAWL